MASEINDGTYGLGRALPWNAIYKEIMAKRPNNEKSGDFYTIRQDEDFIFICSVILFREQWKGNGGGGGGGRGGIRGEDCRGDRQAEWYNSRQQLRTAVH
jgi:hypothetical protein